MSEPLDVGAIRKTFRSLVRMGPSQYYMPVGENPDIHEIVISLCDVVERMAGVLQHVVDVNTLRGSAYNAKYPKANRLPVADRASAALLLVTGLEAERERG